MRKALMVLGALAVFTAGYITGSIQTRSSIALELGGLGKTVESLKGLGKTIVEMQQNVDKLQKNINEVKKVREDISTYQGIYDKVMGKPAPKQTPQQGQQGQGQAVSPELQKGIIDLLSPQQQQQPQTK